jgi:hypothetical protein
VRRTILILGTVLAASVVFSWLLDIPFLSSAVDSVWSSVWSSPFLFSAIGIVVLVIGILLFVRTRRFVGRAASAIGTIMDVKTRWRLGWGLNRVSVVRFQTQDGQTVEFESYRSILSPGPGEHVEVLYDPLNPEEARSDSFMELWLPPLFLSLFGFFFFVFGTFIGVVFLSVF